MRPLRLLQPLLFALALLFAQQGGLTHGIEHTLLEQKQDPSLPHHQHCELCAVYAQIGSAVDSCDVHFDFSTSFDAPYERPHNDTSALTFTAFAARAPPHSA